MGPSHRALPTKRLGTGSRAAYAPSGSPERPAPTLGWRRNSPPSLIRTAAAYCCRLNRRPSPGGILGRRRSPPSVLPGCPPGKGACRIPLCPPVDPRRSRRVSATASQVCRPSRSPGPPPAPACGGERLPTHSLICASPGPGHHSLTSRSPAPPARAERAETGPKSSQRSRPDWMAAFLSASYIPAWAV